MLARYAAMAVALSTAGICVAQDVLGVESTPKLRSDISTTRRDMFVDAKVVAKAGDDTSKSKVDAALEALDKYLLAFEKQDAERTALDATFKFGGASDEAGATDKSKANVGASLTWGSYPHELRFNVDASVQYEDKVVKEDVTTMLVNYDYHLRPSHEAYGFVERFTDSFMNIDQRYEVGLGMKLEISHKASYEPRGFFEEYPGVWLIPKAAQTKPDDGTRKDGNKDQDGKRNADASANSHKVEPPVPVSADDCKKYVMEAAACLQLIGTYLLPDDLAPNKCELKYSASTCAKLRRAWWKKQAAHDSQSELKEECMATIRDDQACTDIVAHEAARRRGEHAPLFDVGECQRAYTVAGCEKFAALLGARADAAAAIETLQHATLEPPEFKKRVEDLIGSVKKVGISNTLNALRKAATRLEFGLAVGALAEFENPAAMKRNVQTLDDTGVVLSTVVDKPLDPKAGQRFRLSVRPSLKLRLGESTELDMKFYYKPALDSPREVGGTRDYRIDAMASLSWKFPALMPNGKNPKITLNYETHYDSIPPDVFGQLAANERLDPAGPQGAARRHRMLKLAVEIAL